MRKCVLCAERWSQDATGLCRVCRGANGVALDATATKRGPKPVIFAEYTPGPVVTRKVFGVEYEVVWPR